MIIVFRSLDIVQGIFQTREEMAEYYQGIYEFLDDTFKNELFVAEVDEESYVEFLNKKLYQKNPDKLVSLDSFLQTISKSKKNVKS